MAKTKKSKTSELKADADHAVMTLTMDSFDGEPREVTPPQEEAFQTPCTLSGVAAGLSGGTLGYVFGFAGYWMQNRLQGQFKASLASGWTSAKTFAIMGGIYAAVSCFAKRIRQKEDAWNGAASGCATGLALGWANGPLGALQSCAMLGAFSFFIDNMGAGEARASTLTGLNSNTRQQKEQSRHSMVQHFLNPALPVLYAMAPCSAACAGTNEEESGSAFGCRVIKR